MDDEVPVQPGHCRNGPVSPAALGGKGLAQGAKLADAQAELVAAQIAQGEAEADAAELRQRADAERRARGVLARLRAAWRGE